MKNLSLILTFLCCHFIISAQDLVPNASHALLKVNVMDLEGHPSQGEIITFVSEKDHHSYEGVTDENGYFEILIPKGQSYAVNYRNFGYDHQYARHEIPAYEGALVSKINIKYQLPVKTVINNLNFNPDGYTLPEGKKFEPLDRIADLLFVKRNLKIRLASHCDNQTFGAKAIEITQKRANSLKNYLVSHHSINPDRLIASGKGDKFPMASNETKAGRIKNNRIEVEILK